VFRVDGWHQIKSLGFWAMWPLFATSFGLAIAEYMPWEAITARNMLRKLPLLAE